MRKQGLYKSIPNEEYHQADGYYSSSMLKMALSDPISFYRKYIVKDLPKSEGSHFDVGNAYHTRLLEPDKYDAEFVSFTGKAKRGKEWTEFKKANEGKIILGNKQELEVGILMDGTKGNKYAMELLDGSDTEVSVYIKLGGFPVKVRFDMLNMHKGYGADPKSTTGLLIGTKGTEACRAKIKALDYDLSAALYMDACNELLQKAGKPLLKTWYWVFASKEFPSCKVLQASELMLANGRKKYQMAIGQVKQYESKDWNPAMFADKIEVIDPLRSDLVIDAPNTEAESWIE